MREELGELDTSSEEENYPESNVPKNLRKYKKQQQLYEACLSPELSRISATTSYPPGYAGSGNFFNHCLEMFEVSDERYREMLHIFKERMANDPNNPKLNISQIDLKDVTARANVGKRPLHKNGDTARKRAKGADNSEKSAGTVLMGDSPEGESSLSTIFNRKESSYNSSGPDTASDIMGPSVQETEVQTDPLTILEEDDAQAVLDAHQQNKSSTPVPETPHQTPTCFFALLRDIFCESAEQKLSAGKLEGKVCTWQGGPTAPLFEWLNYQESWSDLVSSALKFLAGDLINILPDTFVPFLDYKEKQQQWQWIGSGQDSDEQMYGLCQQWLENKDDITSDILETCRGSPPPPRVATGWTVRPTTEEEKKVYREQECVRYQNPHKAFTFKVHGYEAVVGPVKGVYGKESGINKAREHSLLTSDRPPFVTILSLVRDSAARLPNGEGTRVDICELLKDSQYLAPASDKQIHTVVSGALDRLHYEKDPCVKYDVNRKLWNYLHRHRTEEEFERIHQAQAAAAKTRKAVQKNKLPKFKLIDAAYNLPPDQSVKMQQFIAKPKVAALLERTRLRYFSTLQDMKEELGELDTSSEDENYPESNIPKNFRKYKKPQQLYEDSLSPELSRISATTSYPPGYAGSGNFFNHCLEMFEVSEERYREMLHNFKERMANDPNNPKLNISQIDLKDVTARANVGKRPLHKNGDTARKRAKGADNSEKSAGTVLIGDSAEGVSSLSTIFNREESSYNSSGPDTASAIRGPSVQETEVQTDPLTILEEDDAQAVLDAHQQNKSSTPAPETPHQTPSCFFALLRDIFCESAKQKLPAGKLEEKVRTWQGGPTAPLFEWLNYQESWSDLVSSALKFLAGDLINILPDTFVPFLDYKEKQQQWQWIGSGRDSDEQMYGLCQQWLENKDDVTSDILETCQGSPPPPRVTTGWTVRPTAEEEKKVYREQECIRYQNPHKAFTFKVHGYKAVVGPVKGVYGKESGINKAREHSLLTSDRPPFVTILSLVRDSAARLPNGEGTRVDICELLKDSQYLAPASDQQIHTVVSGALDRLHYEKDPCVKYDVNRKLWIYLHRHRTEEEFERIHQAQAAAAKARKAVQKNKLPKFKNKDINRALSTTTHAVTTSNSKNTHAEVSTSIATQNPRGGSSSPRTQGSPKPSHPPSRYVMHTIATPKQPEIKCAVLSVENQNKNSEVSQSETRAVTDTTIDSKQAIAFIVTAESHEVNSSRQTTLTSAFQLKSTKNVVTIVPVTQIVRATPVHLKPIKTEPGHSVNVATSHVHDVLNVDMKPSSPSFVGQPPVLQPILSHTNVEVSNSYTNAIAASSPPLISTSAASIATAAAIAKTEVNCASLPSLPGAIAGFQTIVIKQEPGLRPCNDVSAIPLLSIEERLPSSNPSAINSGPVRESLVHGSQYLSFCNIAASSTTCSSTKPITAAAQNFRAQGANICQQVLSTSAIKVINSAPVSAISDTRVPVPIIALKNQLSAGKESTILTQSPVALNVCGRLYRMPNIRNAAISKDTNDSKSNDITSSKDLPENGEKEAKEVNITALPTPTISYSGAVPITARTTQTVLKVTPK